jgi:ABC-type transport system involved in multi-copper enzyme maturation permease subunit
MKLLQRYGLPLLIKELIELSARRRTYVVRVIYASLVFLASCIILYGALPSMRIPTAATLGIGFPVLMWLGYLLRTGLYLLLPIFACGVFTVEKERNTLGLLFLTQLGPWTIVLEKFMSRLLLAVSFLLISLPILAFAYSLGGITFDDLAAESYSLVVTSIKIVAICVMCSAYCRTTLTSLFASYMLIYLLGIINHMIVLAITISYSGSRGGLHFYLMNYFGRVLFYFPPLGIVGRLPPNVMAMFPRTLLASIPTLLTSMLWLLLARRFLISRAFASRSQWLKLFFQRLDRFFHKANQNRWTRGIELTRDTRLPGEAPVAWREMTTQSTGQTRYLVRLLLSTELPVVSLLLVSSIDYRNVTLVNVAWLILIALWVLVGLVACASAANLIARERSQQTLDVLLATPLSGRDIVQQKMAGIQRLIWICQIPMLTCLMAFLFSNRERRYVELDVIVNQTTSILIYPWLIAWIGMWHGLRSKTVLVAMLQSVFSIAMRCIVPLVGVFGSLIVVRILCAGYLDIDADEYLAKFILSFTLLSPATIFWFGLADKRYGMEYLEIISMVLNPAIHWTLLQLLKRKCLLRADILLGRTRRKKASKCVESSNVQILSTKPWDFRPSKI